MRILLVEDEFLIRQWLAQDLIEDGFEIVAAASVETAVALIAQAPPAAAVVDMELEDGLTGPELVARLEADGIPVIVISGYPPDDERLPQGRVVLQKPFGSEALIEALKRKLACDDKA